MKKNLSRGHNTHVKWISKEKNMIFTKRDDGSKRATSQNLRNERIAYKSKKEMNGEEK